MVRKPSTRLNLGCGIDMPEAWYNVDKRPIPGIDMQYDLDRVPWPWTDGSAYEIAAKHVVEHLTIDLVEFMDECWRVLSEGGTLYLETPNAGDDPDLDFSDPTHKHWYRKHSFVNYFTRSGVERFRYTDRPWSFLDIQVRNNVIVVHCTPVKRKG